jgi:hypothetical protein
MHSHRKLPVADGDVLALQSAHLHLLTVNTAKSQARRASAMFPRRPLCLSTLCLPAVSQSLCGPWPACLSLLVFTMCGCFSLMLSLHTRVRSPCLLLCAQVAGLNLTASALSPDSRWIAASDPLGVKLFQVTIVSAFPTMLLCWLLELVECVGVVPA